MAEIDLLSITPHQVSRDLRGYSVFFYGDPKSGKTTIATKFPNHLILAAEKGFNAIPGAMAQPINSWGEFKKALRQLKDDKVRQCYETIILDTLDILYDYCTAYILANAPRADGGFGVDKVSDIPYGQGYGMIGHEFDECLRSIIQMDYGLVMISHATDKTFTNENGQEYNQIVPTLDKRATNIVSRMADIIGYARPIQDEAGRTSTKLYMRGTPRYMAGSRFKYTPDCIDFTYNNLVQAINDAIDKQMEEDGSDLFTDKHENLYATPAQELDFDQLLESFNTMIKNLTNSVDSQEFNEYWQPRIVQITDKYLGKGNKVNQCSRDQVEALDLIVTDLKDLISHKSES